MTEQIVDLIEGVMPGPRGGVGTAGIWYVGMLGDDESRRDRQPHD